MSSRDKPKKGMSVIIGYVLLVTFAIILGVIIFQWMKSYVPKPELTCPDGVSIFIKSYSCTSNMLTLDLENNGKFDVGGYFIYGTDSPTEELATIDLSKNNTDSTARLKPLGIKFGNFILPGNTLAPDKDETDRYNITGISNLYSIEILPIRWQKENNRNILVSCTDAKVSEVIKCSVAGEECVSHSIEETCGSAECGSKMDNCGQMVNCGITCEEGLFCDAAHKCISSSCTPAQNACGTFICGTAINGTCGSVSCGECNLNNALSACPTGLACIISSCIDGWCNMDGNNVNGCESQLGTNTSCGSCSDTCTPGVETCSNGNCISLKIGNGVCDAGETCAQEPIACQGHQTTCSSGYVCISGSCQSIAQGGNGCTNYCISLLLGYTHSSCVGPPGQCGSAGGILKSGGDSICVAQNPSYGRCCCFT